MRLLLAKVFIRDYFDPRHRPDERTIYSAIKRGPFVDNGLPGRIIGRKAYVDIDALEWSTGNAIADKILAAGQVHSAATNYSLPINKPRRAGRRARTL